jgi:hypothetical protein
VAAPQGNQFWRLRASHGRDKLFASADALWESCCEYFQWVDESPLQEDSVSFYQGIPNHDSVSKMRAMTLDGLTVFLDIEYETWRTWRGDKDFSVVVSRVERIIRDQKFTGAAAGLLNPNIIARDLGLKDVAAHEHTSPDGSMTPKAAIDASKLSTSALAEILAAQDQSEK